MQLQHEDQVLSILFSMSVRGLSSQSIVSQPPVTSATFSSSKNNLSNPLNSDILKIHENKDLRICKEIAILRPKVAQPCRDGFPTPRPSSAIQGNRPTAAPYGECLRRHGILAAKACRDAEYDKSV